MARSLGDTAGFGEGSMGAIAREGVQEVLRAGAQFLGFLWRQFSQDIVGSAHFLPGLRAWASGFAFALEFAQSQGLTLVWTLVTGLGWLEIVADVRGDWTDSTPFTIAVIA